MADTTETKPARTRRLRIRGMRQGVAKAIRFSPSETEAERDARTELAVLNAKRL